jgi:hypothetical protein
LAHYILPVAISHITADIPVPANSESNWEGKSDGTLKRITIGCYTQYYSTDFSSSAGVRSTLSEATSEGVGLLDRLSWSSAEIRNWMIDASLSGQAPQDPDAGLISIGPLVDALEPHNLRLGDWLA